MAPGTLQPLALLLDHQQRHFHQSSRALTPHHPAPLRSFLTNDQTRSSSKYAKGQKNYKINFSLAHSNSTARKRHESTLEMARELERRSLLVEAGVEGEGLSKRAPKGSIELTDYCELLLAAVVKRAEGNRLDWHSRFHRRVADFSNLSQSRAVTTPCTSDR